ncbi:MAG TPA: carboxypeptidase regulatory-like domain-containing protein [Pyrinomonadaceae bacterium]|nr:carboxypeptidase regulatory-like domain-containing protein [Pyrinomonadaceae bacterium]
MTHSKTHRGLSLALGLLLSFVQLSGISASAQDTVTGAFEGTVSNSQTGAVIPGAAVQIINQQTGQVIPKTSDARGRFYQGLLSPGIYTIRVSATGYVTREVRQRLFITRTGEVVPVPVALDPAPAVAPTSPTPTSTPTATAASTAVLSEQDTDVRARVNASDARQGGAFTEEEVSTLPLGSTTFTRTFDELALLLPGVAPPPQTLGSVAGPGVGAGVGSAGQFSVNGLRSRANNFTVDGSDNNDEDIGVRRQGFVALVPQPIESIREYQAITLLAPAQFGRNIGAQVNAVSKSGGSEHHGTLYGFLNTSQLNARNPFDALNVTPQFALTAGNNQPVLLDNQPVIVRNGSAGEDSFTLGQGGFVLGGPLVQNKMFYFISAEGIKTNATREESFAVPTVEQRGAFGTGATGIFRNFFAERDAAGNLFDLAANFPTTAGGDAIFSLYPFPNNPNGVFGRNTFTHVLPAGGQGLILSGKFDANFKLGGREQSITERYNFTDDRRDIPSTGGALFSTLRPNIRTQNSSFFFNSEITRPDSSTPIFNQIRLSYGRTRLVFEEVRDTTHLIPSALAGTPFLLNARAIENFTLPEFVFTGMGGNSGFQSSSPNTGAVRYFSANRTVEQGLGEIGQVYIAGFSPVGVDVFNFPQRRVNNTYQIADNLTLRAGDHRFAFGTDIRRTELNSELPRNSRPQIVFAGAPRLAGFNQATGTFTNPRFTGEFIRPETLVAASAPSGFTQTFATGGESGINLRYYQLNFYAHDDWRLRTNFSLSLGLRYEYNTPPRETARRIEGTFSDSSLALIPGLRTFIGDRTRIFEPDRNNFAPRISFAYAPNLFGFDRGTTVIRAGYGLFYDQILGAVVSQSRNVYPTYSTVDLAGGGLNNLRLVGLCPTSGPLDCPFSFTPPGRLRISGQPLVQPGSLNTLNPNVSFAQLVTLFNSFFSSGGSLPPTSGFGFTIPEQQLETPSAHHYTLAVEQQFGFNLAVSAAYVGTQGRNLLRFTTPNLGRNAFNAPFFFPTGNIINPQSPIPIFDPVFFGFTLPPGTRITPDGRGLTGGRPVENVGTVNRYETTASSRYDSLQLQARGRFRRALQFQIAYTLSRSTDDVSDVFDLAGAFALPQNSLTFEGERAPSNFDARHRFSYNFIYDFPSTGGGFARMILDGLQIAATGRLQSGQPFTVNSIHDVNLDGNLTDRLNNTNGIIVTGDRRQPLRLATDNPAALLAPIGQDGRVGRNSFRAGNVLEFDAAVVKRLRFGKSQSVILRMDAFNFINRANYGIPVRFLEAPGFGQATNTVTPGRRIQFALKYSF